MSAQPHPKLTPGQYLEFDRAAELRHEYYRGDVFAMSGRTDVHATLIGDTHSLMRPLARRRGCRVFSSALRLRVAPDGLHTYPDVMVVRGEPRFVDNRRDTITNPVLLVEVISPSTEAHDRGFKLAQYTAIDTLDLHALSRPQRRGPARRPRRLLAALRRL